MLPLPHALIFSRQVAQVVTNRTQQDLLTINQMSPSALAAAHSGERHGGERATDRVDEERAGSRLGWHVSLQHLYLVGEGLPPPTPGGDAAAPRWRLRGAYPHFP
jgi:hypothetical protein